MEVENSVSIRGEIKDVYEYAAQVELWPVLLPHYRSVEILEQGSRERLVAMHCVRTFIFIPWPCKWKARQILFPEQNRIEFVHVSGPAKGMKVEWILECTSEGVKATIRHNMNSDEGICREFYVQRIVGSLFVKHIASKTLATIKGIVEGKRGPWPEES